ncbi:uncharacterized protein EV154DRAFT_558258 [Mucor mucedo]|uniref:uncharacterized protein n=1 Tax=Mucor mucedo TaxID=29922 RepID=UPI002220BA32|nr:uncharacterized protein EV154DRAFT_558258 [Mucor mucedo]KAI7896644.1 hypothetical protein EV154DRAFT_558258 [Mucor mucedo]
MANFVLPSKLLNLSFYKHYGQQQSDSDAEEQVESENHENTTETHNNTQKNQEDNGSNVASASASTPNSDSVSAPNELAGFIKVSDTFNNNGLVNFSTSSISVVDSSIDYQTEDLRSVDTNWTNTERDIPVTDTLAAFQNNLNDNCELRLTEGKNQYCFATPTSETESSHKPKLRKTHLDTLKKVFHFGTSFSSTNPLTKSEYQACENEQKSNKSLRSLNLVGYLGSLLGDEPFDTYNQMLWSFKPGHILTPQSEAFLEVIKYSLCSFHLVCRTVPEFKQNHERTHFVENFIPSLMALTKIIGFIEFKWCETPFLASSCLNLKYYDYDLRAAPSNKFIDALGIMKTQNNMELIIVEASSGAIKEDTTHTIEDSLKILECSASALKKEVAHYKNASLKTFKMLKVYSLQIIRTQVTLSEMSLYDKNHWKFIEKRSAKLPTNWNDRLCFVQYLELLATLFDDILTPQQVQKQLVKENLGLVEFSGPSVESISQEAIILLE